MPEVVPEGLLRFAKGRSQIVVQKLTRTMMEIESEIDTNEGIYPYNGGKLSQAELCRRAGVSPVTLATPSHRESTRKSVEEWLARMRNASIIGRKSVRRAVTDRADEWKRQHSAIAVSYRLAELEMLDMRRRLKMLEAENATLRDQIGKLTASNVLTPKFKKSAL